MIGQSELREEIVAALELVFAIVEDEGITFKELAERSNLSISTIYRCWGCTFKRSPEMLTVLKLCHAVDLSLNFNG